MSVQRLFDGKFQGLYLGVPAASGTLTFKAAGTSVDKDTYSDYARTTANANPVVLDSQGRATIYLGTGSYDVTFKASDGTTIWTLTDVTTGTESTDTTSVNMVPNGSLEESADGSSPSNWVVTAYTNGSADWDNTDSADGKYSMKFTSTGDGGGYITSPPIPVNSLRTYKISFAYKSTAADVRNDLDVFFYDSNEDGLSGSASTTSMYSNATSNTTTWAVSSGTFTPPTGAKYCKVRFTGCNSADATAGTTWFDNVRMNINQEQASPLTTKGDVWVYTTADARLPIGTDTQLLTVDSTESAGMKWVDRTAVGAQDVIVKTTSTNISATAAATESNLMVIVDASFTSTASNSDITITLPIPSAYANKQIHVVAVNTTGNSVIVNRSGAVSATSTASASPEEWYTGYADGDFFRAGSSGTNEYILDEHVTARGLLALSADESLLSGTTGQKVFDANYTIVNDVGGWWSSANHRLDIPFDCEIYIGAEMTYGSGYTMLYKSGTTMTDIANNVGFGINPTRGMKHDWSNRHLIASTGDYYEYYCLNNQTNSTQTLGGDAALDESKAWWTVLRRVR